LILCGTWHYQKEVKIGMENNTFRAVYDNGEIRFTEPMHMEGEWQVTVTFVQQIDDSIPLEADPHRHERGTWRNRLEEERTKIEVERPRTNPF
jgi:hypothetical protein